MTSIPQKTRNTYPLIVSLVFLMMVLWWAFIFITKRQDTTQNFLYGGMQGVLPVLAGVFGLLNARAWGWFSSAIGRALIFLSTGLGTWGIGTLVFAYYNIFLDVSVPYPSVADFFYIVSWPLWLISMFNLSKATGVKFRLRSLLGRSLLFVIPAISIAVSYYVLIIVARDGVISASDSALKIFFDLAYPVGDVLILTSALLIFGLSFSYLGGVFKWPIIIILVGFVMNYFGDFSFVYATTKGTYFVANWIDLIYTIAFFLLGVGTCLMNAERFLVRADNVDKRVANFRHK